MTLQWEVDNLDMGHVMLEKAYNPFYKKIAQVNACQTWLPWLSDQTHYIHCPHPDHMYIPQLAASVPHFFHGIVSQHAGTKQMTGSTNLPSVL